MAHDTTQPDATATSGNAALPLRARTVMRVPVIWIFPLCIPAVVIMLMTFIYVGSVLNPVAHLHGLPVMVVNQDRGATVGGRRLDEGETVARALTGTAAVSSRLGLQVVSMEQAEVGPAITTWYDHRGLYRLSPEMIAYVRRVADERLASREPALTGSSATS